MKVTCARDKLLAAFQTVAPAVPSRSPKPILQNMKLEVRGESGVLMGTDTEIGIRVIVEGLAVEEPGAAILPTSRFGSILRESTDDQLVLTSDDQGTQVKGKRSTFRLPGEDPLEFPMVTDFSESKYHLIAAKLLRELIKRTQFATDPESHRFTLGGVLLEFQADKIVAVGTDGRRMAVAEALAQAVNGHEVAETSTIVPARATNVIDRALGDQDGECQLAVQGSSLLVKTERVTISARLLEGRFPRWIDVFPKRGDVTMVELPTGPLHAALRQAAIVASEESRGVDFRFSEGQLTLTAHASKYGDSRVELPIVYDAKAIPILLNHQYVSDFLRVLNAESNVQLALIDSDSAGVFSTADGYRYVIMPLSRDSEP